MEATLITTIEAIPPGQSWGVRKADTYAIVANRPEGLVVECGWTVPEQYDDDPESYGYNPFKGRAATPAWIGRRQLCATATDAATVYVAYKTAITQRAMPRGGDIIGSVRRR
jgi:hypothetical protein